MLLECSKKNIAILALAQAAIVLLSSAACRMVVRHSWMPYGRVPTGTLLFAYWGWVGLLIPAAWCILAVYFFHRTNRPVLAEAVIPLTGFALVVLLAIFGFAAAVGGCMRPSTLMTN